MIPTVLVLVSYSNTYLLPAADAAGMVPVLVPGIIVMVPGTSK